MSAEKTPIAADFVDGEIPDDEIPLFENQELLQYDPTTGEYRIEEDE